MSTLLLARTLERDEHVANAPRTDGSLVHDISAVCQKHDEDRLRVHPTVVEVVKRIQELHHHATLVVVLKIFFALCIEPVGIIHEEHSRGSKLHLFK